MHLGLSHILKTVLSLSLPSLFFISFLVPLMHAFRLQSALCSSRVPCTGRQQGTLVLISFWVDFYTLPATLFFWCLLALAISLPRLDAIATPYGLV